ncbi:biotin carboxylase [Salicibibacter halophilus]|uniref:Biotin carboxylase n=1 Tax=Salicibibacter halophilus TaxID=2502791 RepID=A0A514LG13_9BACI|nr:ATP-binding protein [Salicibibacter halophilus]QDI90783.1 biotin carboxylase [Salicibibacter halophilus]
MKIKKRETSAIIEALNGGLVPRRGIQHIMVGRTKEAKQVMSELEQVKEGSSIVKFFIGDFGSGKSFIQALTKQYAHTLNFVVTTADFAPGKRLYGNDGQSQSLYTELMKNLSTPTSPEGGALSVVIDMWITSVQQYVQEQKGYSGIDPANMNFSREVENEITKRISSMDELPGAYDFSRVLSKYYQGFVTGESDLQRKALRWMRGEYGTKMEANREIGVRDIINDQNYYSYLKVLTSFMREVGYAGLVINFDEAINLYKINHSQVREKNYETILSMFNDCLQGTFEGLYLTFAGTQEFLQDERKGLYSYGALKRRLITNPYETAEYRDLSQPAIILAPLKHEEIFVLLQTIRAIHAKFHNYEEKVSDEDIKGFIQNIYSMPGAEEYTKVGHVARKFISGLNILEQNPEAPVSVVFDEASVENNETEDTLMSRFSST